jgi:hypothetical protein
MPATLTTLTGILKELYEPTLRKQLNSEVVALRRLERSSAGVESHVGGKYVTFPIHYGRNSGIGARRELETLPAAGQQATTGVRIGLKYLYGAVGMSGQTFELADKNYQSFISGMDLEINGVKDDLAKDLNRQVYGDGTGAIGASTVASATTTQTVTNAGLFQQFEILDVYVPATLAADGAPKYTGLVVNAVDAVAGTITLAVAPGATTAVGDVWVRTGNANREWTGLKAMVNNTGVYETVDPVAINVWKAVVDSNAGTGRNLSEGLMITNVDKVRVNGGSTSLLLTSLGVRRAYFNLISQMRTFVDTVEFTGGFKGLAFTTDAGEIPLISDPDAPRGTIWGLSEKNIKIYRESDWSFMARDGSMWDRMVQKDGYEGKMYQYSELATDRRNTHFRIDDITEG